jgi:hypothetical protein
MAVVGAFALLTNGCRTRDEGRAPDPACRIDAGEGNRPYFAGDASTRDEIAALVAELAKARGEKVIEVGMRLVGKGEPAVPALRGALVADDPALRANAAYLLGVLQDRRTVPDLRRAATEDGDATVRYEAASALLELHDASGFAVLVGGLGDADARRRAKCIDVLAEKTRERFGFEPDGDPAERGAAIRRWNAWLVARAPDPGASVEEADPVKSNPGRSTATPGPTRR